MGRNVVVRRLSEDQVKNVRDRYQRRLAARFMMYPRVMEVARAHGEEVKECSRLIAWGLLHLGEVTLDDLIRHGYHKPADKPKESMGHE